MSDSKLFHIQAGSVKELEAQSIALEKSLQVLIETHCEVFLGVAMLASEYPTGKQHGGRIDTLGIDENNCPVIIEYKRSVNENVISQGLFYLDWLMDHKKDFEMLVLTRFDHERAAAVEWSNPRLVCIAGDYTKFDEHAVKQINRNIELMRYRHFSNEFLLLELVNAVTVSGESVTSGGVKGKGGGKSTAELLLAAPTDLKDLFEQLSAYMQALGDDVQLKQLKYYFAFKRIKNFACVEVHPQTKAILIYLKINPDTVDLKALGKDFARDVRKIGHFGTGDLELKIRNQADVEKAKPFILKSYEGA
jgi:predicted transport protein